MLSEHFRIKNIPHHSFSCAFATAFVHRIPENELMSCISPEDLITVVNCTENVDIKTDKYENIFEKYNLIEDVQLNLLILEIERQKRFSLNNFENIKTLKKAFIYQREKIIMRLFFYSKTILKSRYRKDLQKNSSFKDIKRCEYC